MRKINQALGMLLMAGAAMYAQDSPRGHWRGSIEIPGQPMAIEVDLDRTASDWIGSVSIPSQNASGIPLDGISVANQKCSFRIKGVPGDPTFKGTLSADAATISGDFIQGTGTFPFKLTRSGDASVEVAKHSPAVAKEFLGTWEGTLEAGQALRLVLKMSNEADGAKAVMVSVDQGGSEFVASDIDQKNSTLTLSIKMIGGQYKAEINKEGSELNGTWTQGGSDLPLKLRKQTPK
jgi:uncharacterized protein